MTLTLLPSRHDQLHNFPGSAWSANAGPLAWNVFRILHLRFQQQEHIKPSVELFWGWGPVWLQVAHPWGQGSVLPLPESRWACDHGRMTQCDFWGKIIKRDTLSMRFFFDTCLEPWAAIISSPSVSRPPCMEETQTGPCGEATWRGSQATWSEKNAWAVSCCYGAPAIPASVTIWLQSPVRLWARTVQLSPSWNSRPTETMNNNKISVVLLSH